MNDLNRNIGSIVVLEPSILDVNTVEERTEILFLNDGCLVNTSAHLRNFFKIDSLEGYVVLFFFLFGDNDSFRSIDDFVDFESQEVLDFKSLN